MTRGAAIVTVAALAVTLAGAGDCGSSITPTSPSATSAGRVVSVPASVFYYRGWGVAVGPRVALSNGITLAPQLMVGRVGGTNGDPGFLAGCRTDAVAFTSSAVRQWGVMLTVDLPVRRKASP